ncbi:hypothetical protein [Bacillus sp. UNC438CL73TsuS30]|uniref:hypothetical protein n=1 Tax=Bacillus sp. UNC438CL73TsuS30 TaxID=1340434 RepID=UPI00047E7E76|nr:hypothetical protein [Bacillus sp. UNC438CL73TsuS30]
MDLKKVLYKGLKYSSVPAFVATKLYEEVTDAVGEKKKDNEVKRRREDAITERILTSREVKFEESTNIEGEVGGGVQGESINAKLRAKGGNSRKMRFED